MRTAFALSNLLIALDYLLIGLWFLGRLRAALTSRRQWRPVVALGAAALFFFGCVATHVHLLVLASAGEAASHWYEWHSVLTHWAQAVGGLAFWLLATRYLVVNVFDREMYDRAADVETEARLHYLAARAGLVRR